MRPHEKICSCDFCFASSVAQHLLLGHKSKKVHFLICSGVQNMLQLQQKKWIKWFSFLVWQNIMKQSIHLNKWWIGGINLQIQNWFKSSWLSMLTVKNNCLLNWKQQTSEKGYFYDYGSWKHSKNFLKSWCKDFRKSWRFSYQAYGIHEVLNEITEEIKDLESQMDIPTFTKTRQQPVFETWRKWKKLNFSLDILNSSDMT